MQFGIVRFQEPVKFVKNHAIFMGCVVAIIKKDMQ